MQAAAAKALRCDPKYLGTAVRLSKGGKNGSISNEPKSCEITGTNEPKSISDEPKSGRNPC